jgi:hypothetical protein
MNVSYFIGLSSAVLLTWLGVTYFHQVPHERYPKQGRLPATSAITPSVETEELIQVTVSITE